MLNVLQLNAPTALAGAERVLLNYFDHHDPRNYSVRLASYLNHRHLDNSFTTALKEKGIPYETIVIGNAGLVTDLRKTVNVLRRQPIDILHTHGYCSDLLGLIAARLCHVPIVSTLHGWTPVSLKLRGYQLLDRISLRHFNAIVCVSKPLHQELLRFGIRPERLTYLPNAVGIPHLPHGPAADLRQQLHCKPQDKLILSVGRLSPEKGLNLLLTSFAGKFKSRPDMRLVIAGEGPQKEELLELAGRLGITEQVLFPGFVSDVSSYYAAADLFVMPSLTEGLPIALLEAMAAGLPVIATAVGGIPDIVRNGKDGCLVPRGDVAQLASMMEAVTANCDLAKNLGTEARETVRQHFSPIQWARALESIYSDVHARGCK
jgi:glycosyltransferase involved in cell wall biosynthesis